MNANYSFCFTMSRTVWSIKVVIKIKHCLLFSFLKSFQPLNGFSAVPAMPFIPPHNKQHIFDFTSKKLLPKMLEKVLVTREVWVKINITTVWVLQLIMVSKNPRLREKVACITKRNTSFLMYDWPKILSYPFFTRVWNNV